LFLPKSGSHFIHLHKTLVPP